MTAIPIPGYSPEIYTQTSETDPYVCMYARDLHGRTARYIGRYKPLNGLYVIEYIPAGALDEEPYTVGTEAKAFCFLLNVAMEECPGIINPSKFSSLHPVD